MSSTKYGVSTRSGRIIAPYSVTLAVDSGKYNPEGHEVNFKYTDQPMSLDEVVSQVENEIGKFGGAVTYADEGDYTVPLKVTGTFPIRKHPYGTPWFRTLEVNGRPDALKRLALILVINDLSLDH